MPVKKKPRAPTANRTPARKRAAASDPARQIAALRAEVKELRARLQRESRSGRMNARLLAEAKKARMELGRQFNALHARGAKLAAQLKSTLGDSRRREKAREEALARVEELRQELARRTDELRRKSDELKQLAQESAHRAAEIIRSEQQPSQSPPSTPSTSPRQESR